MREVVLVKIIRRQADKLLARAAILRQHRVVDFRHALVRKNIIQNFFFINRIVPAHRLVEHHEKEAVERLRKKHFQSFFALAQIFFSTQALRNVLRHHQR